MATTTSATTPVSGQHPAAANAPTGERTYVPASANSTIAKHPKSSNSETSAWCCLCSICSYCWEKITSFLAWIFCWNKEAEPVPTPEETQPINPQDFLSGWQRVVDGEISDETRQSLQDSWEHDVHAVFLFFLDSDQLDQLVDKCATAYTIQKPYTMDNVLQAVKSKHSDARFLQFLEELKAPQS